MVFLILCTLTSCEILCVIISGLSDWEPTSSLLLQIFVLAQQALLLPQPSSPQLPSSEFLNKLEFVCYMIAHVCTDAYLGRSR